MEELHPNNISKSINQVKVVHVPLEYQQCPLDHFLRLISRMLSSLIYMNDYKLRAKEMLHQQKSYNSSFATSNTGTPEYSNTFNKISNNIKLNNLNQYTNVPATHTPSPLAAESPLSMNGSSPLFSSHHALQSKGVVLTRFHSKTPPEISVLDYLYRLTKFSSLDHTVLLATLSYIDLLMLASPAFEISSLTVHRFLLAATTVACKGLRDSFYTNEHYAKVGGVNVSELNVLEQELLTKINYRILPRDFTIDLLRLEIEKKRFVVFPNELIKNHNDNALGYDLLTNIYHSMVALVGKWETVIYVSDRLPVYFGSKEQQLLLQFQRSMWSKDVNFIENSKHKITYTLDQAVPKQIQAISEVNQNNCKNNKSDSDPEMVHAICQNKTLSFGSESTNNNSESKVEGYNNKLAQKKRKPTSSMPSDLLAKYFNSEIYNQTQVGSHNGVVNEVDDKSLKLILPEFKQEDDDMNNGIYKRKKISPNTMSSQTKMQLYNRSSNKKTIP